MPTKGSTEQKTAILGGHVDVAFMNLSQMLSNHRDGKAKIIAITTKKRSDFENTIPTAKEQGYELYMTATRGFVIQSETDPKIQKSLDKLLKMFLQTLISRQQWKNSLLLFLPWTARNIQNI